MADKFSPTAIYTQFAVAWRIRYRMAQKEALVSCDIKSQNLGLLHQFGNMRLGAGLRPYLPTT